MQKERSLGLILSLAVTLVASAAGASSTYPAIIQSKLGLALTPQCTLCHADLNGGANTIVTYFGLSTQDFGLQGERPDLLDTVLDRLISDQVDADGDGFADVDELRLGSDPNDGPGPVERFPRPGRGCAVGASSSTSPGSSQVAWLAALALCIAVRRRSLGRTR